MKLIKRTTRFGVFPAMNIGRLCILHFPGGRPKFGFNLLKRTDIGNGIADTVAVNLGRMLVLYESPRLFARVIGTGAIESHP